LKNFEFENWDHGRMIVNRETADLLRECKLENFESLYDFAGGTVAKNLLRERTTTRIELTGQDGTQHAFYLKRHAAAPWKEHIKPFLRFTRPILGARNEWNAILRFHEIGIPTMTPVALGESGQCSFLMTKSIEGCQKLSHWMESHHRDSNRNGNEDDSETDRIVDELAAIARSMHAQGMHHQDFYLTHLLRPLQNDKRPIHVIDLGRVRKRKHLSKRWIVKDLSQLNYSANLFSEKHRQRFLEAYLERPLEEIDRGFIRRIERKTAAIARHSLKNRL
jgi:heptose I phosphotransferase